MANSEKLDNLVTLLSGSSATATIIASNSPINNNTTISSPDLLDPAAIVDAMIGSDYLAGDLEADSKEEDELTRQVIMNHVNVGQVSIGGGIVEEEEEEEIKSNLETIDNLQELASKETRQFELINNNNGLTEEDAPTTSKSIIYT